MIYSDKVKIQIRDKSNLFSDIEYPLKEDGLSIDWKKMLKPEHLAIKDSSKEQVKKKLGITDLSSVDPRTLEDKYLMILLSGIKYLAKLRGYISVENMITSSTETKAVAVCKITWLPILGETHSPVFSDCASASVFNTESFGKNFLESIAANRAFVRAVRNFLEIDIVASDELCKSNEVEQKQSTDSSQETAAQISFLKDVLKKNGFEKMSDLKKSKLVQENKSKFSINPDEWTKIDNLEFNDVFLLLALFK